jgi:spoIIIJ-associated protein
MAITDKIAVAKRINELLTNIIRLGTFKLKYRIVIDPPWAEEDRDWERPMILVDFSGSDSGLLTERGGELLRAFEYVCKEACRLGPEDHDKVTFDAMGFRKARFDELKMAAQVAAERVQHTKEPYEFSAMSSRERRIIHLALKAHEDLRTESEGEGPARHLVVYPKDYKGRRPAAAPSIGRRRR